jgi:hypothetical protein
VVVPSGKSNRTLTAVGKVPEPAVRAQLILGFSVIGIAARRTRRTAAETASNCKPYNP